MIRVEKYLDGCREQLRWFATSQVFFGWASLALSQGADADAVQFHVMSYNIRGKS